MHAVTRALFSWLALVLFALPARATTCVKPDLMNTFPPDGATEVPPNATLLAHYNPTAVYLDEDVTLAHGKQPAESVPATFDQNEGLLSVKPPFVLVSGEKYTIRWPGLRGTGTASRGTHRDVTFTVGSKDDVEPPTFEGLLDISWDVSRSHDDCTDSTEERFVFDLTPGKAHDDSGTESLALVVFQSRGGDVDVTGKPQQVLVTPFPADGTKARVERSIDAAEGHVCFDALVRDLTGQASSGGTTEVCVHATPPPFFYGCRYSASPAPRPSRAELVLALVALSLFARRRHRPTP